MTRAFWCFISYRHADNKDLRRQWATWLHQGIETYEVPADLVGTTNDRGEVIPERIFPIFRDEEELPADADLAAPIYRALDASKYLLVICSPRAVESTYVAKEIVYFKKLGREDRVLAAIIDGEPNASWDRGKQAAGFRPEQECFPEPLRHRVNVEGQLLEDRAEPIAADFRLDDGAEGWTSPEAYRQALSADGKLTPAQKSAAIESYRKKCALMKLKIIAGILGVALGTLTKRDAAYQLALAQRRARIRNAVLAVVSVLAVVAVAGGIVAWMEKQAADVQRNRAEKASAENRAALVRSDFLSGAARVQRGNAQEGLAYFAAALRLDPGFQPAAASIFTVLTQQNFLAPQAAAWPTDQPIWGAAFSPDGKVLAVATHGSYADWIQGSIHLVDPHTGQPTGPPLEESEGLDSLAFSPDGRYLAARSFAFGQWFSTFPDAGYAPTVCRVWDLTTGRKIADHADAPYCRRRDLFHEISPDGTLLVVGTGTLAGVAPGQGAVHLEDAKSGKMVGAPIQLDRFVENVVFSPDGRRFAVGTGSDSPYSGEAFIWDSATGKLVAGPLVQANRVFRVAFSPEGSRLLTCCGDGTARLWDCATGRPLGAPMTHASSVGNGIFSPDGNLVATASSDGTCRLWNAWTGSPECEPLPTGSVMTLAFSPDGRLLLTGGAEKRLHLWRVAREFRHQLEIDAGWPVTAIAFNADGSKLATGTDGTARVWDAGSGAAVTGPMACHGRVDAVGFNPAGTRLATASGVIKEMKGQADVWDAATGAHIAGPLMHDLPGDQEHSQEIVLRPELMRRTVAFSADGKVLVTASQDRTARVWNGETGAPLFTITHDNTVCWAGFSRDGRQIISADGNYDQYPNGHGYVMLADAATGSVTASMLGHYGYIYEMGLSADGSRMVSASVDWTIQAWLLPGGAAFGPHLCLPGSVRCAAMNHDGTVIAAGVTDRGAYLWTTETGAYTVNPLMHGDEVDSVAFSPDDRFLLTASMDGTARVWDTALGQAIGQPNRYGGAVGRAIYNPDATRVGVACADGRAYVFDLAPSVPAPAWLPDLAEAVAGFRLTDRQLIETVSPDASLTIRDGVLANPGDASWAKFARWYFADEDDRAVSPWSTLTVADEVQRLVARGTASALDEAAVRSFGHPDWQAQLGAKRKARGPGE